MIRTCLRLLRCGVSIGSIEQSAWRVAKQHKIDLYPITGYRHQKLGACVLNQPANQNLLTVEFMEELVRFLSSYQYDDSVENIWMESKKGVFCHGVDYKQLVENPDYLDKLYYMGELVGRVNKPIIAQVEGGAKGAGAYLLSMLTMPLSEPHTYLQIDEVNRGLIPLMGGTHRLSHLPLKLGYYMALVGDSLTAEEMRQISWVKGGICPGVRNLQIREHLARANLYFRDSFRYTDFDVEEADLYTVERERAKENKEKFAQWFKYSQADLLASGGRNLNVKFAANQRIAASSDYHNVTNPYNSFTPDPDRTVNNYYQMRLDRPMDYLIKHKLVERYEVDRPTINRIDMARVDQIFSKNTIEQILEALQQERTPWAQRAYRKMREADPLALQLTFRLLKEAERQPWIECARNEYRACRRLLEVGELKLRTSQNKSEWTLVTEHSGKAAEQITQELVDLFMRAGDGAHEWEGKAGSHSLHPYVDYYQALPDSVRTYLNREEFIDKHRSEQGHELRRWLRSERINYASQVYDVDRLRRHAHEQREAEKQKQLVKQRLGYFAQNDQNLQRYRDGRLGYLQKVQESELGSMVEEEVRRAFADKLENRFSAFEQKTAKMMGFEGKLSLFKRIKSIMVRNILYNGAEYEEKQKQNTPYQGQIYFDPQGKDIFSSRNQYLAKDKPLAQLADDLSTSPVPTAQFEQHSQEEMPRFFNMPEQESPYEEPDYKVWEHIKWWYDDRPEYWAQTYTYKELITQAARTSEELAGYLEWTYQNYYDLLLYSEKHQQTFGEFAEQVVEQVHGRRKERMEGLEQVERQRRHVLKRNMFSQSYELRQEETMRKQFPYFFDESTIPAEFRTGFLKLLDATIGHFMASKVGEDKDRLLLKEELGGLDKWINREITTDYTEFLRWDVEYVASYLQMLVVKELIMGLSVSAQSLTPVSQIVESLRDNYGIDLGDKAHQMTVEQIHDRLIGFLMLMTDMHTRAKAHIKSPQTKLIDFINRLKLTYEQRQNASLPYSFEGLLLMIGKDRQKIYDSYLGKRFASEPEVVVTHLARQSKLGEKDYYRAHFDTSKRMMEEGFDRYTQQNQLAELPAKRLVQNYFYYMMAFEKHIHQLAGEESFLPKVEDAQTFEQLAKQLVSSSSHQEWLRKEVRAVIDQLLSKREAIEPRLSKGELTLYDNKLNEQLTPAQIRRLVQSKLEEEIYLVKNFFHSEHEFDLQLNEEEREDEKYARMKRNIKNPEALKRMNNMHLSEEVFQDFMTDASKGKRILNKEENDFFADQSKYFKTEGFVTRLPWKTYQRVAKEMYAYPQDATPPPQEPALFKSTNLKFKQASGGEKIHLTTFGEEYKRMEGQLKNEILDEMVSKIRKVEEL